MNKRFKCVNKPLLFSWILVILNLSLIIKSGLYSDDIQEFQRCNSAGMSFMQILHYAYGDIVYGIGSGRFTPVTYFLADILFWASHSVLVYKLFILFINLMAVYMFTAFLRALYLGDWVPFSLLVYSATTQFYINYHDAFTSLHAMYPFMGVLIFSAVISLLSYIRAGKPIMLIWSLLMTVLAVLDGEVGFVVYPLIIVLLVYESRDYSWKLILLMPYFLLLVFYGIFFALIRIDAHRIYTGVSGNFDPSKMYNTFFFQVWAAIPMAHFTRMPAIPEFLLIGFQKIYPLVILCLAAFAGLFIYSRKEIYERIDSKKRFALLLIGLTLLILPACILMVSAKYQEELGYGKGYLPAYVQDFGFVLLVLAVFSFISQILGNKSIILKNALCVFFFLISVCTMIQNNALIESMNRDRATPAVFYYNSLKNGILNDCEDGSVIVLRTDYFWRSAYAYEFIINNFYKNTFHVIEEENFKGIGPEEKRHFYMLEHNAEGQFTLLYRILPNGSKVIKRINYPTGRDFNYWEFISRPL